MTETYTFNQNNESESLRLQNIFENLKDALAAGMPFDLTVSWHGDDGEDSHDENHILMERLHAMTTVPTFADVKITFQPKGVGR